MPYQPGYPVTTAWDLGFSDSTAIWFAQVVGREVHVIDYYQASGAGLEHYVRAASGEAATRTAEHLLPHDAASLGTRHRNHAPWKRLRQPRRARPHSSHDHGGRRHQRRASSSASLLVRRESAARRGWKRLRLYQREWDEKAQDFRARPLHDWTSHGADAFRYLAMGIREEEKGAAPMRAKSNWNPLEW